MDALPEANAVLMNKCLNVAKGLVGRYHIQVGYSTLNSSLRGDAVVIHYYSSRLASTAAGSAAVAGRAAGAEV
jgi:hypothetical protein